MRTHVKFTGIAAIAFAILATGVVQAVEEKARPKDATMPPEMVEAIQRGAPGVQHKALEPLVGKFTVTTKMWMKPGEEPKESTGTAEHTWVLGGRFLKMKVSGDIGGQTFEGFGYLGYDNVAREYVSAWLDSMSTGIGRGAGQFDSSSKTLTEKGTFSCPMTGEKDMPFRSEWKIGGDTLTYTMYYTGEEGKEVKGMEATYKRVK